MREAAGALLALLAVAMPLGSPAAGEFASWAPAPGASSSAARGLDPYLRAAGVSYPPGAVVMVGLKHERRLELYAGSSIGSLRFIRDYRVLAASGVIGPKRVEGDRQVPEGIYHLIALNANSRFHRSLELDYPNRFDREMAAREGRRNLGNNIFIHGGEASAGCLALGDQAAEELFALVDDVGLDRVTVILSPWDFRNGPDPVMTSAPASARPEWSRRSRWPAWVGLLYARIQAALEDLPPPAW